MENQNNTAMQNLSQASQNPVVQPVATPKTNYLMIGGVALVCSLIFGFGGYYLGKQSSNSPYVNNEVQTNPTTTPYVNNPSSTSDPTASWKIYTNKKYKFEIKHPKDALVGYFDVRSGLFNDPNGEENQIDILLESQTELFKTFIQIEITDSAVYKKSLLSAITDVYNQQKEHFQTTNISPLNPIKFLNYNGYEYTFSGQAMRAFNWGGVVEKGDYKVKVFEKDGYYFAFYSRIDEKLDQILSTFKLTQ